MSRLHKSKETLLTVRFKDILYKFAVSLKLLMNKRFKIVLYLCSFCFFWNQSLAQDYKFNQYYNSPLNLNPALTGKTKGLFRLAANYRVQSQPVSKPAPYNTMSASADFGLFREALKGDIFGLGLIVSSDRQAGGALKTNDISASLAYHKSFGYYNEHYLSAGFQVGIKNRKLDPSQLYFESQFNPAINGFDLSLPNLENFQTESFTNLNVSTGIFWSSNFSKTVSAFGGLSIFNLLKPKDSFFNSESARGLKFHGHGGVALNINDKVLITPNGIFMTQFGVNDWIGGSMVSYNLSDSENAFQSQIFIGAWYEGTGALIASAGTQIKGIQFTVSYDRTLSELKKANKGTGGMEVSLLFQSSPLTADKKYSIMHCPVF